MAAPVSVDGAAFLREHVESASPDLLRAMVKTFAEALMSAEADALCGAGCGERSDERVNSCNAELRMMQLRAASDADGIGAASARHEQECGAVWSVVRAALAERYLAGVSPVVMDDFEQAVGAWRRTQNGPTVREHADFFAASAVAVTRPDAVISLLAAQRPRAGASSAARPVTPQP